MIYDIWYMIYDIWYMVYNLCGSDNHFRRIVEESIMEKCNCNYGLIHEIDHNNGKRQCNYFDMISCVNQFIQGFMFSSRISSRKSTWIWYERINTGIPHLNLGCPRSGHSRTDHGFGEWDQIELYSLIPNWCLKILCDVIWRRFSSSNAGNSAQKGKNA